ncbi:MAG: T9SS type A sorting domain-containing protein [Bacteroidetes bacterium]|nr:T9SS type A sorting domain-containing protein [Bacteroidota bacterium]
MAAVSEDKFNFQLERVLYDSVHNKLIVSSKFFKTIGNLYVRGICSWDGNSWDSLSSGINTHDTLNSYPNGMALSCIPYNGKLLVGGMFQSIGGVNATSLALWDGVEWDSLPVRAFQFNDNPIQVLGFCKFNNLIYIYGTFDTIGGQPASGIATWDGISFQPIILPVNTVDLIRKMVVFKNELYVGGQFFDLGINNGLRFILKFDGSNWVTVGGGLLGYSAGLTDMLIYKNELYVGGHFLKSEGNVGENIMKWDGTQWYDVGMDGGSTGAVWQMLVYKDKLWTVGSFITAANIYAPSIASYDSIEWCALYDDLNNTIGSATVFNDTMYVAGGFQSVNGDTNIRYLAKLKYPGLFRQCVLANSVDEIKSTDSFQIYPNPTNGNNILVNFPFVKIGDYEVLNVLGAIVKNGKIANTDKIEIDLSLIANGCYFVKIICDVGNSSQQNYVGKFLKN